KLNAWVIASRPKTLVAALIPVMVGSALAFHERKFFFIYSLIAWLCSILIQIGTNFTNDLYDFVKGADTEKRKGPQRVLVSGLISVKEMKAGIFIIFGSAFLLGLYLVSVGGAIIFIVGVISIIAGIAYTAGPYPLAYHGLGDVFVFIFFGMVGTIFTYYLHTKEITFISILISIPVGALITNILVVNNFRDIEEDRSANKNTLAVIFGKTFTRYQFIFLLIVSFITPLLLFLFFNFNFYIFLPFLSFPVAVQLIKMLYTFDGIQLNKTLEMTAKLTALFGLLFSLGIIL
ncbi:MAG: 1,4-dihydroxy-2-naphthoate polyprenyltransferase, partial [Ignavibacteriaceae bacterium]